MPDVEQLISAEQIASRVAGIAREVAGVAPRNGSEDLLVLVVLKGAFVFGGDLVRALDGAGLPTEVDFMALSSYGNATTSSGEVRVSCEPRATLAARHVLLVDDILDSGRSLAHAHAYLTRSGVASTRSCVLLDKPSRRVVDVQADHVGFEIEDRFVVGYGLDWAERFRHLPYVGVVSP